MCPGSGLLSANDCQAPFRTLWKDQYARAVVIGARRRRYRVIVGGQNNAAGGVCPREYHKDVADIDWLIVVGAKIVWNSRLLDFRGDAHSKQLSNDVVT